MSGASASARPLQGSMTIDWNTGDCFVVAKDGRRYSLAEIEAIERAASSGDAAAAAALAALDQTPEDEQVRDLVDDLEAMARTMHDCPMCREERARTGKDPEIIASWIAGVDPPLEELIAAGRRQLRDEERRANPHWWQGRGRRRRRGRR